ncbi:hypothetical protein TNCV_4122421 [Trichonephila clavipes]|nr:hypothetical protein TNCV_4122421 [Trichonephila clavipes]
MLQHPKQGRFPRQGKEPTPSFANGHSNRETTSVLDPVSTKTHHQDPLVRRSPLSLSYCEILKPPKN